MPDSSWLSALKLPLRVMTGIAIACAIALLLDSHGYIDLSAFGSLARLSVVVGLVLSGPLAASGLVSFFYDNLQNEKRRSALEHRRDLQAREKKEKQDSARAAVLARLDHLSPLELRLLADALREGTQSFTTWVYSPSAGMLQGKGLIYTTGGQHHQDYYPFIIHDFVWTELLRRKAEFIDRDEENKKRDAQQQRKGR